MVICKYYTKFKGKNSIFFFTFVLLISFLLPNKPSFARLPRMVSDGCLNLIYTWTPLFLCLPGPASTLHVLHDQWLRLCRDKINTCWLHPQSCDQNGKWWKQRSNHRNIVTAALEIEKLHDVPAFQLIIPPKRERFCLSVLKVKNDVPSALSNLKEMILNKVFLVFLYFRGTRALNAMGK